MMVKSENAYDILLDIIGKKTNTARNPSPYPFETERMQAITLHAGLHERDAFAIKNCEEAQKLDAKFANVYIEATGHIDPKKDTVIVMAHHDVVDPHSYNVEDNTASVANVLNIARKIKRIELNVNVVIAVVDAEEIVSLTSSGSARLAKKIKEGKFGNVIQVINLELTAKGTTIVADAPLEMVRVVNFPPNDAMILRHLGLPAVCITALDEVGLKELQETGHPTIWKVCHKKEDDLRNAIAIDMEDICDWVIFHLERYEAKKEE